MNRMEKIAESVVAGKPSELKRLDRLIDDLTIRLINCDLNDFDKVQKELFEAKRKRKVIENARVGV